MLKTPVDGFSMQRLAQEKSPELFMGGFLITDCP